MKATIKTRKSILWNLIKIPFPGVVMDEMWLTFGKTIWCPAIGITPDLIEHEAVHVLQQRNWYRAIWWWIRYMADTKFRYSQEAPAYRAQYRKICETYHSRDDRFKFRRSIASIMSGDRYKNMVDFNQAMRDLEK